MCCFGDARIVEEGGTETPSERVQLPTQVGQCGAVVTYYVVQNDRRRDSGALWLCSFAVFSGRKKSTSSLPLRAASNAFSIDI